MHPPLAPEALIAAPPSMKRDKMIDFGNLDETSQRHILSRLLTDAAARAKLVMLNPWLEHPGLASEAAEIIADNRKTAVRIAMGPALLGAWLPDDLMTGLPTTRFSTGSTSGCCSTHFSISNDSRFSSGVLMTVEKAIFERHIRPLTPVPAGVAPRCEGMKNFRACSSTFTAPFSGSGDIGVSRERSVKADDLQEVLLLSRCRIDRTPDGLSAALHGDASTEHAEALRRGIRFSRGRHCPCLANAARRDDVPRDSNPLSSSTN